MRYSGLLAVLVALLGACAHQHPADPDMLKLREELRTEREELRTEREELRKTRLELANAMASLRPLLVFAEEFTKYTPDFIDELDELQEGADSPVAQGHTRPKSLTFAPSDVIRIEVSSKLMDEFFAPSDRVTRGARIVPSIKAGRANGFKLYAIRPSSPWAELGLMNGDTIHAINGFFLHTPDEALEVYSKLKGDKRFEVDLTRRGKSVRIVIEVL